MELQILQSHAVCIMFNKYHASDSSKWTRKAWLFVNRAPWSYGKGLVSGM